MKRMSLRLLCLVLALWLAFGGLFACGNSSADPAADTGKTLNIALYSDMNSLDPLYAYDHTTNLVVNQITEGVLTYDENSKVVPNLAESWEVTDPTTYVYNMRDNVTFSDGSPMTMEDVLYSLERHRQDDLASYVGWMYDSVDTIEQTGDWQFTVKLKEPDANWQYVLATTAGHIISKAYCEEKADTFGKPAGGIIGTGAYVFDSWTTGSQVVLKKNPDYWAGADSVDIDTIVYKIITEDTSRVAAIVSGQVDFAFDPPEDMLDQIRAADNVNIEMIDTMMIMFLAMNTSKAPFDDINVRRAISCALDKQSIMDNIIKDSGLIASNTAFGPGLYMMAPEAWSAYVPTAKTYDYDMDQAAEYLSQSAYPDGFDTTIMYTSGNSVRGSISQILQAALTELGINAEIVALPGEEQNSVQFGTKTVDGSRDYDIGVFRWEADFPDVSGNLMPLFYSANAGAGGANCAEYRNETVDELLHRQSTLTDVDERVSLLQQANDIIVDEAPIIVIDYPKKIAVVSDKLSGFTLNASWIWNFTIKDMKMG